MASGAQAGPAAMFRSLRHRDFRIFVVGQSISLIGTWMQMVAESWLIYRLTGSSVLLGFINFAAQAPVFLLAPLGGALADKWDRRRILIWAQALSMLTALALAGLTLSGRVEVWHVFALGAALGCINAFDIPARQVFLVDVVGKDDLVNAVGLNSSMFHGARMAGPAVAGLVVAAVGEGWCFFLNGVSYVAVIAGLMAMRVRQAPPKPSHDSAGERIREGFRFCFAHVPIRSLMVLMSAMAFMALPFTALMPIFAEDILHSGPKGLGILMSASGLGSVAGALLLAMQRSPERILRWIVTGGMLTGVALTAFSWSRSFWLSALLLAGIGFTLIVQMGAANTLIQTMAPDELRGRVMAVYAMTFMGAAPLGSVGAGAAAARVGAPLAVSIGGVACLIASFYFAAHVPAIREQLRRHEGE